MKKCRFALLALIAVACCFLAYGASSAKALVGPGQAYQDWWYPGVEDSEWQGIAALLQEYESYGSLSSMVAADPSIASYITQAETWINPAVSGGTSTITSAEIDAGLATASDAEIAGGAATCLTTGVAPCLLAVGVIGASAGLYAGYKYVGPWLGNTIYKLLNSDDGMSTSQTYWWESSKGSASLSLSGFPAIGSGATIPSLQNPIWYLQCGSTFGGTLCPVGSGSPSVNMTFCIPDSAVDDPTYGSSAITQAQFNNCEGTAAVASKTVSEQTWDWYQTVGLPNGTVSLITNTSSANVCNNAVVASCFLLVRSPAEQEALTQRASTTSSGCTSAGIKGCQDAGSWQNTQALTEADIASLIQELSGLAQSTNAAVAADAEALLEAMGAVVTQGTYQGPGTGSPTPPSVGSPWTVRLLPLPEEGEDPADYIDRVRTLGWIGVATVSDATAFDNALFSPTNLCPTSCDYMNDAVGSIVGVSLTGTTPTIFYNYDPTTGTWAPPLSEPKLSKATTAITIYTKPSTTNFPPPGGGGGTSVGSIDWTPIESLDLGSKFPFGAFNYIPAIDGSSSCPDLNIPWPSALGSGSSDISFCSTTWETDYRPWVFPIVEILMTVAGVAFLAFKVFGTSGD